MGDFLMEAQAVIICPECGSDLFVKDGHKTVNGEDKQRYKCKVCHLRFTLGHKGFNVVSDNLGEQQICAILQDAKNLQPTTEIKTVGDTQEVSVEAQIVNYLIRLKNDGKRDSTIEAKDWQIKRLVRLGANLHDPESVKNTIANLEKTESYKLLLCIAYEGFLTANGLSWERPGYKQSEPLPFCPHESELDNLIAGCNKKTSTFLKLLKETAMRPGEAWLAEWMDFDPTNRTFICKNPEKNSRPRAFDNLSPELCQMLLALPHNSNYIFTCSREPLTVKEDRKTHMRLFKRQKGILTKQRQRIAIKLKNPRITEISYCSCRHWKATQLYHQTKDILYVMKFLGHRNIKNTLVYIDLERLAYPNGGDDYTSKAARTEPEALSLIEAGFEYVCDFQNAKLFRKRK